MTLISNYRAESVGSRVQERKVNYVGIEILVDIVFVTDTTC